MSPAPYVPSIAIDNVIVALGGFLGPFVGGSEIVRGQGNRVSMPADGFVVLTELLQVDLETPTVSGVSSGQVNILTPKRIDVQIDFYGPPAGDWCTAVKTVYRTSYAVDQFPAGIAPLYCSDGVQGALTNAEKQYESRWILTASLQYNPSLYVPQQAATQLKMALVDDLL